MRRREEGFTFVEVLLALAIGAFVVAAMYGAFNTLHKWWISASVTADQRQSARTGLETVTRDLEMAGYHTTSYGDPNKTGIAITLAAAGEIEIDQQRPESSTIAAALPVYEPRLVYYHLATDLKTGRQHLYRQTRTEPGLPAPDELVAENVAAFSLAYYDKDDNPVAGLPPASPGGSAAYVPGVAVLPGSPLRAIRRIGVTVTTVPARAAPFGPGLREFSLAASVTPPNLGTVDEVTPDPTPPAVPTGLAVVDTRSCGAKLRVKWDANTEPDLDGYIVFYGPTRNLRVPVRALGDKDNPEITLNPAALLITKDADRATAPNTHAIQVAAYDSSGNRSARSAPVSGNPTPDVTAFGGADDTTVNPLKPSAPTGLTVTQGSGDGELVISWQAPADGTATSGFRLYRSTAPFADGHIDGSLKIATEADLLPASGAWTDRGLEGCETYHYAVASVNCDETLVATYLYDSGNSAASDYAVGAGAPRDSAPPPAPSLEGSQPERGRILITLENPLEEASPDFDRTEIFWSKSPPEPAPQLDAATGTVSGGRHLPDSDVGIPGTFRRRGSQVVVFDDELLANPPEPTLKEKLFNLLAVSYDRCGNASAPDTRALLVLDPSTTCDDEPPGPPPPSFSSPGFTSCQPEAVKLAWEYPGQDAVADLAGFRVARTGPGGTIELADAPTLKRSWTDAGPLEAGGEYTYTITATDCAWEQYLRHAGPLPYAEPLNALTIGPINPGGLRRYVPPAGGNELAAENFVVTVSDLPSAYTHHNNVRLSLQNTSMSRITIRKMAVDWDKPGTVLDRIVLGGSPSGTTERVVTVGGAAPGVPFNVEVSIADVAGGVGSPSGAVPLLLRFTTPDGAVSRVADLRSQTLTLSLWVRNESLQDADCPVPTRIVLDVPRGPALGGFSQSAPGSDGIDSYAVTGPTGAARDTDVRVPHGTGVNVFGTAFDYSRELFADGANRGFAVLKVVGIDAPAADPATVPAMPATGTFFERPLQSLGGNRYAVFRASPAGGALMPQESGAVLWYYGLVVDNTGNWDRAPDPDRGSYAYFQPPFDACGVTPRAPVLTLASTSPGGAELIWTAPTEYEDGNAISAGDSLTYDVYVKGAGGDPWPSVPQGAGLTGLAYTHGADLLAGTYYYMVVARNSCPTEPRLSAESNVVVECEGDSGVDCSLFSVPATAGYGEPIRLSASGFCDYRGNGVADGVVFRVTGDATTDFAAAETGDEGAFLKTITAVGAGGGGGDAVPAPAGALSVQLIVEGADACAAATVSLTGGECLTTPNPPTSFSAVRGPAGSGAAILTWFRPNFNTDGSTLADLAGYGFERARCADASSGLGTCSTWSGWVGVDVDDPAAQTYTWPGFVIGERYKFRMRAKDTCTTPNYSSWTVESPTVRIR